MKGIGIYMGIAALLWSAMLISLGIFAYREKVIIINKSIHKLNLLFISILIALNIIRVRGYDRITTIMGISVIVLMAVYFIYDSLSNYTISVFNSDSDKIFNIIECMLFIYGVKYKKDKSGDLVVNPVFINEFNSENSIRTKSKIRYTSELIIFKGYRHINSFKKLTIQLKEELMHKGYTKPSKVSLYYIGFGILCIPMAVVFFLAK